MLNTQHGFPESVMPRAIWQDCATITRVCMTCVVWGHGVVHCSQRACLSTSLRQRHIAGQDGSVAM